MNPPADVGGSLLLARRIFLERGEIPDGLVNERLLRSWQRSHGAGLTPAAPNPDSPRLSDSQLHQALEAHHDLGAHALPVMEYLYEQVRASHSMVILADNRGLLVRALGDPDFLGKAERVSLAPGASWHEQERGTNAIGTALAEGAPIEIRGAEHFLERNAFLTCAAAPIYDSTRRLLGIVDISGDQRSHHPHTYGLVRTAARMIENALLLSRHRRDTRLHFHTCAEGIGTLAEGIVAVSEDGWIVGANQAASLMLGLRNPDMGATLLARVLDVRTDDVLHWGRRRGEDILMVTTRCGNKLFVQVHAARAPIPAQSVVATPARTDALSALDTGDPRMKAALDKARKVAGKPIPVLLHGESGAGKELLVQAIHRSGPRHKAPLVAVNCAALPENLIEAELFGYAAGAFTGASRDGRPGRLVEAQGGTLFLDEIGDMPLGLQGRLLRVLQERQVTPLGAGKPVAVDFALVCATHRPLREEVEAGRFRADLYYRLNGLTLTLPPLRERSDFSVLVVRLLQEVAPEREVSLAPAVARAFAAYSWPGNLRQLANALRTATALLEPDEEVIDWEHLPDDLREDLQQCRAFAPGARSVSGADCGAAASSVSGADCGAAVSSVSGADCGARAGSVPEGKPGAALDPEPDKLCDLSRRAVRRAIESAGGNMSEAARRLGISRNTLYRKCRQTGG